MRKLFSLVLFSLISSALISCSDDASPNMPVDVHIIMGQSNGIGRASTTGLPTDLRKPLPGCYIFNKASGKFEVLQAGVNTQTEPEQFGPVVKAAQLLQEYKKQDVYFVVAGVGNTQLYHSGSAEELDWHPDSHELLHQAEETIEQARKALAAEGKQAVFKSIAWWQGEKDALEQIKADSYQKNEDAFFKAMSQVAYLSKAKRVVYKIFPDAPHLTYADQVNQAKVKRAAGDPGTVVIETAGYKRIPQDKLHANTEGQLQAGTDLFGVIKDL